MHKRCLMGFHRYTLVARGADTQLDPSCVSAPPATNVELFACFADACLNRPQLEFTVQTRSQR